MEVFKEKKHGKTSLLRVFLAIIIMLLIYLVGLWSYAFISEVKLLSKEFRVDYSNLFIGLGILLGTSLLGLAWKVIQKKYEIRTDNE